MSLPRSGLARASLLLVTAACAQMDPPPGGPEDRTPPTVVVTRPDSMAVVPGWRAPVVIVFSERISERQVEESVMVSPRTSPVAVDRGSREIRVSLRRGWEPGQIYHVMVRPLVQDLFNNRLLEPVQVVFSTGPAIPDTRLSGLIIDRITGEPQEDVRVEAIRRADSLVYAAPTDSAGLFVLGHIPEGEYLVRAFPDPNRNRNLDAFEERDSVALAVTAGDSAAVQLSLVLPDTSPPHLASVRLDAEQRVELRFDDYLDPGQAPDSNAVTVVGPDGTGIVVASVMVGTPRSAPADTGGVETPPLPSQLLLVALPEGVELTPEAVYEVRVTGVRNIVGLTADVEGEFTAPELPPEPAAPDTVPPEVPEVDGVPPVGMEALPSLPQEPSIAYSRIRRDVLEAATTRTR